MHSEDQLNTNVNHYVKHITIDNEQYYLLIMDEYDELQLYSKDKYNILEILQDIDCINAENSVNTSYFEEYYNMYITTY